MVGLGEKGLRERDGQNIYSVGPVNPFPPRGSPLMSKIVWHLRKSYIIKEPVFKAGSRRERVKLLYSVYNYVHIGVTLNVVQLYYLPVMDQENH